MTPHARRHLAERLAAEGRGAEAEAAIAAVLADYEASPPNALELANARRVSALAAEACGDRALAIARWRSARDDYAALDERLVALTGGNPGVAEADDRLIKLQR